MPLSAVTRLDADKRRQVRLRTLSRRMLHYDYMARSVSNPWSIRPSVLTGAYTSEGKASRSSRLCLVLVCVHGQ